METKWIQELGRCDREDLIVLARTIYSYRQAVRSSPSLLDAIKQFLIENTSQQLWTQTVPLARAILISHQFPNDLLDIIIGYHRTEARTFADKATDATMNSLLKSTDDMTHGTILQIPGIGKPLDLYIVLYTLSGNIFTSNVEYHCGRYFINGEAFSHLSRKCIEHDRFGVRLSSSHPFIQQSFPFSFDNTDSFILYPFPQVVSETSRYQFETCSDEDNKYFYLDHYSPTNTNVWTMISSQEIRPPSIEQNCFELRHLPADHSAVRFLMDSHWEVERSKIKGEACAKVGIHTHYSARQNRVFRAFVFFMTSVSS